MRLARVGSIRCCKKTRNGLERSELTAIIRFWGFPMGLMALPMVTAKARDSSSILADIFSSREK